MVTMQLVFYGKTRNMRFYQDLIRLEADKAKYGYTKEKYTKWVKALVYLHYKRRV